MLKTIDGLTPQQEAYAIAFVELGQKAAAFRKAYNVVGLNNLSVGRRAWDVHRNPLVQQKIDELKQEIRDRVVSSRVAEQSPATQVLYGALQVFQHWQAIALADPRKIVTVRRICCRYCHGKGHLFQWRDADEFAQALADVMDANASLQRQRDKARGAQREAIGDDADLPTDDGGYGFRFNEQPHKDCPRCLGEGSPNVFVSDFSKLDDNERRLLKSVEVKKDGSLKVHMHDQSDALANMAKALGMLVDKFKIVDPQSKEGEIPALPLDPTEASRVYAEMLKGS